MKKILFMACLLFSAVNLNAQNQIYFCAKPNNSSYYTIYSMKEDGSNLTKLFSDSTHRSGCIASTDGKLYYRKNKGQQFKETQGDSLWICKSDLDGTDEQIVYTYPNFANFGLRQNIAINHNYTKILFATYELNNRDGDVFELDIASQTVTNLTNDNDFVEEAIDYSPDDSVLYTKNGTAWYASPWPMYKMSKTGTNNHLFQPMSTGHYHRPNYNLMGTKLAFCYAPSVGQPYSLYISNANGSNVNQLIPSTGNSSGINEPHFSPDGSKIIFSRNAGNQMVITDLMGTVNLEINPTTYNSIQNIFWATNGTCYQTVYDTVLTTVTDTLLINATLTAVAPPNNQTHIKIFPNPAKTHITIDYGNISMLAGYTCKITNSLGQTVFTTPITQQQSFINLSSWSGNGIYFVHLIDSTSQTIDIKKIVIQ